MEPHNCRVLSRNPRRLLQEISTLPAAVLASVAPADDGVHPEEDDAAQDEPDAEARGDRQAGRAQGRAARQAQEDGGLAELGPDSNGHFADFLTWILSHTQDKVSEKRGDVRLK